MTLFSKKKKSAQRKKPLNENHIIGFLFTVSVVLSVFLAGLLFAYARLNIPDISSVAHYQPPQASLIYDRQMNIIDRVYSENRTIVPLNKMSSLLPKAFVAAEDGRFFEHPGLDSISVLRALFNNLRTGRKSQGGSTITQQVAKGLLLSPEKTYLRKFKEAILAYRIDSQLSKDEILYIYLNQIYLGSGAYGVEAAAMTYFDKHASQLNLAEIAILAGLPQAPSRYSPFEHWERARSRQRYVLNRMAADGYITEESARRAYAQKTTLAAKRGSNRKLNGYYLQIVRKRAEQMLSLPLQSAAVKIYTNLDQSLQVAGLRALNAGIERVSRGHKKKKSSTNPPQGALVCIDSCTGKVRSLAGGTDYAKTKFNRAVQARRPAGSVFKPLVYSVALGKGMSRQTIVRDEPIAIRGRNGETWKPRNFDNRFHGSVTLQEALVHSYNIPAIKVLQHVGVTPVHNFAKGSGIHSKLPKDLSLALGSADVSPLEMTSSYIPIICDGRFVKPTFIDRIETLDGKELYRHKVDSKQVMNKSNSIAMKKMLIQTIAQGTGKKAAGLPGISGGKTGTSDNNRDAWFIGFNNDLLAGVWIGHDRNQSLGSQSNGGSVAAPIWRAFMEGAHQ